MTPAQDFVASLVGSLVWPTTVVVLAVTLRRPIMRLLTGQTPFELNRVSVNAGVVSGEWTRSLIAAGADVAAAVTESIALPASAPNLEHLYQLSETNPAAAVLQAYEGIEFALREILGPPSSGEERNYLPTTAIREAAGRGLVGGSLIAAVDGLAVLRNLVVNAGADQVDRDQANEYLALANATIYALQHSRAAAPRISPLDVP